MTETIETRKLKQELTKEEKKARNRENYLKFIEKCRNPEERKKTPEEKKEALAIRRQLYNKNYKIKHREEWNNYMRTRMRERYRNDEPYRKNMLEQAKIKRALKKAAVETQGLATLEQATISFKNLLTAI